MKNLNNKGITLIALIITIIVMLILATVSIGAINGGLFEYAEKTKAQTDKVQYIQALQSARLEAENFREIKTKCLKNKIFEDVTFTENIENETLLVVTQENYRFLVTMDDVVETN